MENKCRKIKFTFCFPSSQPFPSIYIKISLHPSVHLVNNLLSTLEYFYFSQTMWEFSISHITSYPFHFLNNSFGSTREFLQEFFCFNSIFRFLQRRVHHRWTAKSKVISISKIKKFLLVRGNFEGYKFLIRAE
jgi:hypothetical protein